MDHTIFENYIKITDAFTEIILSISEKFVSAGIKELELQPEKFLYRRVNTDSDDDKDIYVNKLILKELDYQMRHIHTLEFNFRCELSDGTKINLRDVPYSTLICIFLDIEDVLDYKTLINKLKKKEIRTHYDNKTIIITDPCYFVKTEKVTDFNLPDDFPDFEEFCKAKGYELKKDSITMEEFIERAKIAREFKVEQREFYSSTEALDREDDWDKCSCGENMETLGFKNFIISRTLYGDWGCTTYDTDTNEKLGVFCADAGLVGVFDYDEVITYNPEFEEKLKKNQHIATVIPNFTGDVWFELEQQEYVAEEDSYSYKKGDILITNNLHVVGEGTVNFKTTQTEL